MKLSLQSEEYPPTGGMGARGVKKSLGKPKLHPLELMVREAAQNSWDARLDDSHTVEQTANYTDTCHDLEKTALGKGHASTSSEQDEEFRDGILGSMVCWDRLGGKMGADVDADADLNDNESIDDTNTTLL